MCNGPFALAVGTHKLNLGDEFFADHPDRRARMAEMGWDDLTEFNVGPAGSTAVYSGKTWHAGTNNCSDAIRKGLNINFVPRHPLDTNRRNHFDVCAIDPAIYQRLAALIGEQGYLIAHETSQ
jgi:ectoine hydroxylase-related dioxygenase (phytanoyl-CoA dioxygenase family)